MPGYCGRGTRRLAATGAAEEHHAVARPPRAPAGPAGAARRVAGGQVGGEGLAAEAHRVAVVAGRGRPSRRESSRAFSPTRVGRRSRRPFVAALASSGAPVSPLQGGEAPGVVEVGVAVQQDHLHVRGLEAEGLRCSLRSTAVVRQPASIRIRPSGVDQPRRQALAAHLVMVADRCGTAPGAWSSCGICRGGQPRRLRRGWRLDAAAPRRARARPAPGRWRRPVGPVQHVEWKSEKPSSSSSAHVSAATEEAIRRRVSGSSSSPSNRLASQAGRLMPQAPPCAAGP